MTTARKFPAKTARRRRTRRVFDPRVARLVENAADLMQRIVEVAAESSHAPAEKTVHKLRTGTRRCGALLQSLLDQPSRARIFISRRKDAEKLLRQWKKLRRAAGAVRDMDVHRELVARMLKTLDAQENPGPQKQQYVDALKRELERLDTWLKGERHAHSQQLQKEAAKRLDRCRQLTAKVLGDFPQSASAQKKNGKPARGQAPRYIRGPALLALDDFYKISETRPMLDRENLHDFRKETKEARYVAEAGGEESRAKAVAKALKRIQDEIGGWHDLDALTLEARQALGNQSAELRDKLHQEAERKLQSAIASTEKMRRILLGERLALQPRRGRPSNTSLRSATPNDSRPSHH